MKRHNELTNELPTNSVRELCVRCFIAEACRSICALMCQQKVSPAMLFDRLKGIKSKVTASNIEEIMSGSFDMTIRDCADIFFVLGASVHLRCSAIIEGHWNQIAEATESNA